MLQRWAEPPPKLLFEFYFYTVRVALLHIWNIIEKSTRGRLFHESLGCTTVNLFSHFTSKTGIVTSYLSHAVNADHEVHPETLWQQIYCTLSLNLNTVWDIGQYKTYVLQREWIQQQFSPFVPKFILSPFNHSSQCEIPQNDTIKSRNETDSYACYKFRWSPNMGNPKPLFKNTALILI